MTVYYYSELVSIKLNLKIHFCLVLLQYSLMVNCDKFYSMNHGLDIQSLHLPFSILPPFIAYLKLPLLPFLISQVFSNLRRQKYILIKAIQKLTHT